MCATAIRFADRGIFLQGNERQRERFGSIKILGDLSFLERYNFVLTRGTNYSQSIARKSELLDKRFVIVYTIFLEDWKMLRSDKIILLHFSNFSMMNLIQKITPKLKIWLIYEDLNVFRYFKKIENGKIWKHDCF